MRLFHQLAESGAVRPARPLARVLPVSLGLHALAAAALLAMPFLTPEALPEPARRPMGGLIVAPHAPVRVAAQVSTGAAVVRRERPQPPRTSEPTASVAPAPAALTSFETGEVESDGAGIVGPCPDCVQDADAIGSAGFSFEPSAPPEPAVVRVGRGVEPPRKLRHVAPLYPELARRARVEGTVTLECVIDPQGRVAQARVLSGSPLLDEAALDAVRQWLYTPTRLGGVPVAVILTVTVRFELR
jgi:protein TonB